MSDLSRFQHLLSFYRSRAFVWLMMYVQFDDWAGVSCHFPNLYYPLRYSFVTQLMCRNLCSSNVNTTDRKILDPVSDSLLKILGRRHSYFGCGPSLVAGFCCPALSPAASGRCIRAFGGIGFEVVEKMVAARRVMVGAGRSMVDERP